MLTRPILFFVIAILFAIPYNFSFDIQTSIIPRIHLEFNDNSIYNVITFAWLLGISFLYKLSKQRNINISTPFFVFHVFVSLLPLLVSALPLRRLYFQEFQGKSLTMNDIDNFYNIYFYTGLLFLIGQLMFTTLLLFRLFSKPARS